MQIPQVLKAINESIAHWEEMRDNEYTNDFPGPENCSLCKLYNHGTHPCLSCPIYKRTGELFCDGTPFLKAALLFRVEGKWEQWQKAAQEEIDFLKSLLE